MYASEHATAPDRYYLSDSTCPWHQIIRLVYYWERVPELRRCLELSMTPHGGRGEKGIVKGEETEGMENGCLVAG